VSALAFVDAEAMAARLARPPETLRLSDGRVLAYDRHGCNDGPLWIWHHGGPSCRLEATLAADWAAARGLLLVAFDRPGLGGSSPRPGVSALAIAEDVAALADHLGARRFTVFGGSGGGPYALACARAFPERLDAAVCVASGGVASEAPEVAGRVDRLADLLSRWAPWVLGGWFHLLGLGSRLPPALLRRVARGVEAPLLRTAVDTGLARRVMAEVLRQGASGAVEDFRRAARFGFTLGDIDFPVLFVQGTADPFVPVRQTRRFAELVPRGRYLERPGAGHGGTIFGLDRVLGALDAPA
jgi:pimeloyl-ACP methyl ester carboxylesterase